MGLYNVLKLIIHKLPFLWNNALTGNLHRWYILFGKIFMLVALNSWLKRLGRFLREKITPLLANMSSDQSGVLLTGDRKRLNSGKQQNNNVRKWKDNSWKMSRNSGQRYTVC